MERADGEGASIDDCEAVSREVSTILDASDEIPHRYSLEVSSAGLERKLYTLEDAERFVGRVVRVQTENPVLPETDANFRGAERTRSRAQLHGNTPKGGGRSADRR